MPAKVLLLAVDAADRSLLRSWAEDGTLPTWRTLLRTGLVGETSSPAGFYEGSTWPSFYTGLNPARHGFHRLVQLRPGSYRFQRIVPGKTLPLEPFWRALSRAGRRVAILDVPLAGLETGLCGIQVVEWGTHDPLLGWQTWPPELKDRIRTSVGEYPVQRCDEYGYLRQLGPLRARLLDGVGRKLALTRQLLQGEQWDFFAQVFTEGHCIGHQGYHLHDASHPSHPGQEAGPPGAAGDCLREVYVAIDRALGELLAAVDPQTLVIVLASHRMSHTTGAAFLLPELLVRLGYAQRRAPESAAAGLAARLGGALGAGWRRLPAAARARLAPVRDGMRAALDRRRSPVPWSVRALDLARSQCFPQDNGNTVSGLRINLAGREPCGIVQPGREADRLFEQLAADLGELVDAGTGLPLIRSVQRTRDLHRGEQLDHLPDLLVEWNEQTRVGSAGTGNPRGSQLTVTSAKLGAVSGRCVSPRTGDHRDGGLFIATGAGLGAGQLDRTVSIMDFAPTFAGLLGVHLPGGDGVPIPELLAATGWPVRPAAPARRPQGRRAWT